MTRYLLLALCLCGCTQKAPHEPPKPKVQTLTTALERATLYRDYVGQVAPLINVKIRSQVSGILIEQLFVEGAPVKKGDLLFIIDPRPYEADLAKAEAQLAQGSASLRYAEERAERYAKLAEEEFVSTLDFDEYITTSLTTEAEVKQAEAMLTLAKINLDYCYIRAPMNGIAGLTEVKPGNYVDAALDTTLTTLNQIDPILVTFFVPQNDLASIQQRAAHETLAVEVFQEGSLPQQGTLSLIDNTINCQTGAILCQATLSNSCQTLWPGHFVNVRLLLNPDQEVISLPTSSIFFGQQGAYVYVVGEDQTVHVRPIKIAQRDGEKTFLSSGLSANEIVVVTGQLGLFPGASVEVLP